FSAHMVQHLLLLLVIPLCLLLSLPRECMPSWLSRRFESGSRFQSVMTGLCWLAGLGTMWLWHVPSLCNAATESESLGIVRSTSFLLAGLMFWLPIFCPANRIRLAPPSAVVYLFSACLGCTLLGIYITFTTITVCPAFANPSDRIGILRMLYSAGLTPAADQQLGGLLMWVPPCLLYVCAIISVMRRWYEAEDFVAVPTVAEASPSMTKVTS
ncbi:MAG: cytochrome c oxidase assembly protein, partial [Planctomycetaceae bacterium]|nr:cytochrome c oxidase assembly protein [Planctomycetaceae bacterium]